MKNIAKTKVPNKDIQTLHNIRNSMLCYENTHLSYTADDSKTMYPACTADFKGKMHFYSGDETKLKLEFIVSCANEKATMHIETSRRGFKKMRVNNLQDVVDFSYNIYDTYVPHDQNHLIVMPEDEDSVLVCAAHIGTSISNDALMCAAISSPRSMSTKEKQAWQRICRIFYRKNREESPKTLVVASGFKMVTLLTVK